jgi:TonB family protein
MAVTTSAPEVKPPLNAKHAETPADERLPKWILLSLAVHGILVALLLASPLWRSGGREPPPSYVVDLVGGERIGGKNLGTKLVAESKAKAAKPEPPPAKAPPAPEPVERKPAKAEKVAKQEKTPKPEKIEKVKAKPAAEVALDKPKTKVKPQEEKPPATTKTENKQTAENAEAEQDALEKVRERVIQAAIERARSRAAVAQASPAASPGKTDKGEPLSAGNGEGIGAQSLGKGGVGGEGILKSVEYIRYINYMQATLKNNWAWAGPRRNLQALVRFGVKENGEIVGVKIIQSSGDPLYDESVIRAVKKSSPLAAPPENHRKDFADVEYSFQPDQVG